MPPEPLVIVAPSATAVPVAREPMKGIHRGTVAIHTQGCKLNQADSEQLARRFAEAGYFIVDSVLQADVFVLNTCTVTATADAKARQALRAAHRANPEALIVATGCYAQRSSEALAKVDGVTLVIGNTEKDRLTSIVTAALDGRPKAGPLRSPGWLKPDLTGTSRVEATAPATGRNRAMVKIQEGCNQVCSYCIVPKVRGRERSIPSDVLVEQINSRVAQGCQEVVLTGTQLGTYGYELSGINLKRLLETILTETTVPRLRVSSLQPQEISPDFLELWQDRRLCPHFHVPLQSGSDLILRTMRRRYDTAMFAQTVELIRRTVPHAGISADLIVGFPGEGDTEFAESHAFAQAMEFSDMHIFPFSPRPGTSATYLRSRTPEPVKKARTAQMLQVAKKGFMAFRHGQLGQTRPVLWESVRDREGIPRWSGLTDNYIRVFTNSGQDLSNTITPAQLTALAEDEVSVQVC